MDSKSVEIVETTAPPLIIRNSTINLSQLASFPKGVVFENCKFD